MDVSNREKIKDAIIIHGPGRSGTTLLYNVLAMHPDLAWISGYVNHFPDIPILSVLNRLQNIEFFEQFSRGRRKWPRPAEAYGFWNFFFPDFSLMENGTSTKERKLAVKFCIKTINSIVKFQGKKRFIAKLTGTSRASILDLLFENPFLIYINRDPRAVVASYFKQRWGYKDNLEKFEATDTLLLISEYVERYRKNIEQISDLAKFRYKYVSYEDLIANKTRVIENLLQFLGLDDENPQFNRLLESIYIDKKTNEAWKQMFSSEATLFLESQLENILYSFGYEKLI